MELSHEVEKLTVLVRLGKRVRRLREGMGLSIRELCEQVGPLSHSYLGRVELGQQFPSFQLVKALDDFFEADGVLVEFWEMANDELIPDYARKVVSKEPEAVRIQVFHSSLVTALLQTESYAREVFRSSLPEASEEMISELLTVRIRRRAVLDREDPPYYWAILDESALKRPIGCVATMIEQLQHVLQAAQRPRIAVQVLPFARGGHPMMGGSLTLHTLQKGGIIGGVENFCSGDSVESPKVLAQLAQFYDLAVSMALPEKESLDLIRQYLKEYENESR